MTLSNPEKYYTHFLKHHQGKLHFAAHSHHFWPDVTRDAQLEYWDDCAKLSDDKWDKIFTQVYPKTRQHIANILNLKNPQQIALAPNTHELTARILSLFIGKPKLNVLTTTSEFHSWRRQLMRLSELPQINIEQVNTHNFLTERSKCIEDLKMGLSKKPDICFISQVFYDSGLAFSLKELKEITDATSTETILVIDGYHGFAAIPTDLSELEGRIFYLGGGYKYAQAGEGVGFLVVPKGNWRPTYTGWFAEHADLSKISSTHVGYSSDGMAFMGATQDPSGCYRFNAVWDLFKTEGINIESIHEYVTQLQNLFLNNLPNSFIKNFNLSPLFSQELSHHGHFLTFETPQAIKLMELLHSKGIWIDRRGPRLRFGFGIYQQNQEVSLLCQHLDSLNSSDHM